jgi:hypothetical protein
MSGCPSYVADPSFQITQGGTTGPYDCTAHSASDAIDFATCGAKDPGGRTIRLLSSEPVPDPASPGLKLAQVAEVAIEHYGVYLDVRTGARAVTWDEYERRRKGGQGAIVQVSYAPIAATKYDAFGSTFFGGHAMFESVHATYDPGADGRRTGIWKFDGTVYPRELMKRSAGLLDIGTRSVGYGLVWAAFTRDVIPDFKASVPAGYYHRFYISNGRIVDRDRLRTGGFSADCSPPRLFWWPAAGKSYRLVQLRGGAHKGQWIAASFAHEV